MEEETEQRELVLQQLDDYVPLSVATFGKKLSSEDQVAVLIRCRVKTDSVEAFTKWLDGILEAAKSFNTSAWRGKMVLGPTAAYGDPGHSDFIIMFRYSEYSVMHSWLLSPERAICKKSLHELNARGAVSSVILCSDIQEGTVAIMPPKMTLSAWDMLTTRSSVNAENDTTGLPKVRDVSASRVVRRRGPPPKWRTTITVWLALMMTVLPWNYTVAPWLLGDLKVPLFWYVIIILIPVVVALKWFLLPLFDRMFAPCIYDIPRCPAVEPCLTLQNGCPCFRPDKKQPNNELREMFQRVKNLELQLQSNSDFHGNVRRRMLERIDRLESQCTSLLEGGHGGGDDGASSRTVQLEDFEEEESDEASPLLGHSKEDGSSESKSGSAKASKSFLAPASNGQETTTCIRYNVRPECFVLFEEWVREISRAAANCIEGHRGALIIRAPTSTKKTACTHVLIYAYDTREHMNQWHDDPIRKDLVDRMLPLLVQDNATSIRVYDSFADLADAGYHEEDWFFAGKDDENSSAQKYRRDPTYWKMLIIITVAHIPVIIPMSVPYVGPWVKSWGFDDGVWLVTMVQCLYNACWVGYVMVPILMILTKKWVFAPWIESDWMLIAWCQRGFQCWDDVGRKLREGN